MTQENLIMKIQSGSKSFGKEPILHDVNLSIKEGEFITLLGPSGSGKSTLLKLLAGLESWTTGHQQSDTNWNQSFVFQDPNLLSWRTVLENILLPLEFKARSHQFSSPTTSMEQALSVLKMVHLEDYSHFYPHQLSGGMKMRTSLARSLVNKPQLLFMDEPFAALDEPTRENLQEQVRLLWEQKQMTIVFVTHSLQEALFLSNRILYLKGKPASLFEDITVKLPTQRNQSTRSSNDYFEALRDLRKLIHTYNSPRTPL